jgi:hypothetical protein
LHHNPVVSMLRDRWREISYLRFCACYEDRNATIRFRNKRFNQFFPIVLVIINIVAIYGPLKVKHDHIVSNYAIV